MEFDLINLRKEIHQYPEVSGHEEKTAGRILKDLKRFNPDEIITGLGGYGVLAHFKCSAGNPKKTILFRAELDAISVREETGLAYQSKNKGAMHGCGHDGHMTILIGLVKWLDDNRPDGIDVYILFQPAEETGEGAARVLDDSRFQALGIDHGFSLHNLPGFPEKAIICRKGTFAAGSVGIEVTIKGAYSHAAYPEQGINPSGTVAALIQRINQELKGYREDQRGNKLACTFIKMGERTFGISPGKAVVGFTIRSASDDRLEKGVSQIRQIIDQLNDSFKGEMTMNKVEPFRAVVNNSEGSEVIISVSREQGFTYQHLEEPFPWSEDFGEFRQQFPITIFGLGAGEDSPPLHSEHYDFNDELIDAGVRMFSGIVDYYSSL